MKRMLLALPVMSSLALLLACSAPRSASSDQLDALFYRLRTTPSAEEARDIELAIQHRWSDSGRQDVDALMLDAIGMAHTGDLDSAIQTLDQVVAMVPNFAEAYNQRALVHAMRDEYPDAIDDISHVLALEPRQFAALAGLGRIFLLYDKDKAALMVFDAALAIDPHLDAVRNQADRLREQLAGLPI